MGLYLREKLVDLIRGYRVSYRVITLNVLQGSGKGFS
ncbi:hypothetical protein [Shigella phage ESh22]|nr:hypothetical protein [Shigella phage ESh22]